MIDRDGPLRARRRCRRASAGRSRACPASATCDWAASSPTSTASATTATCIIEHEDRALREDRRARQARLPARPRRPPPVRASDATVTDGTRIDSLTERDIAKTIDHSLLRPELDDAFVEDGCRLAAEYDVASVCVRPADVARGRAAILRRDGRRGRHDHRLPARQPPDRDEGLRGAARPRRRRDRARHGHPHRRAQVRPRRGRPGRHRRGRRGRPRGRRASSRSSSRTPT